MRSAFRRLILLAVAVCVLIGTAPSVTAAHDESAALVPAGASLAAPTVPACEDPAFNLTGGHWTHAVHWRFNADSTPSGLSAAAVERILRRSFNNVTGAHNNCGLMDKVSARNVYEGRTRASADISRLALCMRRDGQNVVSFGPLPRGILAATCTRHRRNRIVEADIRINSRYDWALKRANCSNQELLEPTVTHEVGHVYGLGHVSDKRHPRLTMSTRSDGACSDAASSLGLGDILGLERLY